MRNKLVILLLISSSVLIMALFAVRPEILIPGNFKFIHNPITKENPESPSKQVSIIFGGDLMFDRYIRQMALKNGYDNTLVDLEKVVGNTDFVVANLEGPLTDYGSISIGSEIGSKENYIFTFDPEVTSTLLKFRVSPVNVGNNHILNFGQKGLEQTIKNLDKVGIEYFGDVGMDSKSVDSHILLEKDGIKVAIINYNEFGSGDVDSTLRKIKQLRNEADWIVVYTHWGTEYVKIAPQYIQDSAHKFLDGGANVIIGSHPHVVQQSEVYKGKKIYYSLGNLVMDQYFNEEVRNGLLVKMVLLDNGSVNYEDIPIYMDSRGRTTMVD